MAIVLYAALLPWFVHAGDGESGGIRVYCHIEGQAVPLRDSGVRKDKAGEGQKEYNKYIIVATSLEEEISAGQVLELYRARWQIELAFKRLKSLFGYGRTPMKAEASAYAGERTWRLFALYFITLLFYR
jgi:IS4 transposase